MNRAVVATVGLGLLEVRMQFLDLSPGSQTVLQQDVVYMTIVPDVLKHVLSQTLFLVLKLGFGWGVVAAPASGLKVSMRLHYNRLVILGALFFILTASSQILDLQLIVPPVFKNFFTRFKTIVSESRPSSCGVSSVFSAAAF